MIHAGSGFSENTSVEKAFAEAAAQALERSGLSKVHTLMAFASFKNPEKWPGVFKKLKSITGAKAIVGSSAFGVLTEQTEIEERAGVAVMALEGTDETLLPFLLPNLQESNLRAGASFCEKIQRLEPSLSVILPDAFSFQYGPFFDGFEAEGDFVPLIGGCASEQGRIQKTFQWLEDRLAYDAVSGLAFGRNVEFEIGITQSCQPFGEPLQVTRSQGNMIFEMEGRPAYDILHELISHLRFENSREIFHRLFLGVPLEDDQTEFGRAQYLVRNIMGVNAKKRALTCAANIEEGEYVTFTLRDPGKAKEDMALMLQDLRQRGLGRKPAFGLYFNCCARGTSLYGKPGEDTALIREYFPDVSVAGFFTFGEIAPVAEVNHFHHYSGILAMAYEPL